MDARSINNNSKSTAADNHVEQLRQKIGTEFTDQKKAGHKRNEMGKDDFVKLMSAQLKYQDPINPLKNEEMAAQLAQFSALEQMMNVNQNLEKMAAAQKPQDNVLAASLIGKKIQTDSSRFNLEKGGQPEIKFGIPSDAETVNVSVVDAKGEVIREIELGAMVMGDQSIRWDGKNKNNQQAPVGEYTFRVSASANGGKPLTINTGASGVVSGVVFEGGKPLLLVGDRKIALESVGRIESDSPGSNSAAPGAADAVSALTKGKNTSVTAKDESPENGANGGSSGSGKTTQQAKNNLQSELTPEKIKLMLEAMRASPQEKAAEAEPEASTGGMADPLWNPANM
jgi:flagellar basal-body rod modification protein FlgD